MRIILAGILAAGLAWGGNKWLLQQMGNRAMTGWGPALEETLKTGIAIAAGVPVLPVHAVMGTVEMLFDLSARSELRKKLPAGLMALGGHLLFGSLTIYVYRQSGIAWLGLAAGILAHQTWNKLVINLSPSASWK